MVFRVKPAAFYLLTLIAFSNLTPLYAQSTLKLPQVDIQGDYASFDDIIHLLEGKIDLTSTTQRTYTLGEQSFVLDLTKQMSWVNDQIEPYQLQVSEQDNAVLNLVALHPIPYQNDYFPSNQAD